MTLKSVITALLAFEMLVQPLVAYAEPPRAASAQGASSSDSFLVQKEETAAKSGSVYVTPTKKNEVLFRASIWGAVQYPGVHYMPLGTRLLDALSLAGGPIERADMDKLILSTHEGPHLLVKRLSVTDALANADLNPVLKPDDVLVVHEDRSLEKASFYLQVGAFALSVVAVGLLVRQSH